MLFLALLFVLNRLPKFRVKIRDVIFAAEHIDASSMGKFGGPTAPRKRVGGGFYRSTCQQPNT
jgi:hypothetical protein